MDNKAVVAVGMSGGVDSSVAAYLLVQAGYRVVGVSHYIWEFSSCCEESAMQRAEAVCRQLGMPYFRIDLFKEFENRVIDDFTAAYLRGETPNPCVRCNETIRFSLFPERIRERLEGEGLLQPQEPLYMATGHYVRLRETETGTQLLKGRDHAKEQSYMLYRIPRSLLSRCMFPLGDYIKPDVVEIARRQGLPTASIKESQDICFVDGSYTDFIRHRAGIGDIERKGPIYNIDGKYLGEHRGYIHYTIGQRQGLGLSDGPWYVAAVDARHNAVTVGRKGQLGVVRASINEENWLTDQPDAFTGQVKLRYNSREVPAEVRRDSGGVTELQFSSPQVVTPGQSAVVYDGDRVLGGGILQKQS